MTVNTLSSFRLAQVQTFIAVVRYGSYSEAARQIGCAQTTVSRSIEGLNEFVKGRLFNDDTTLTLTALGDAFLPRAIKLMEWAEECRRLNRIVEEVAADEAAREARRKQFVAKLKRVLTFRL